MNLSRMRVARQKLVDCIGRSQINRIAATMCRILGVDPMDVALEIRGINKFESFERSGEIYFLREILRPRLVRLSENPVIIEVGANVGIYTSELKRQFPHAQIHAFEPGDAAFSSLQGRFEDGSVHCHHTGCGREEAELQLFTYQSELDSEHATLFPEVMTQFHGATEVSSMTVKIVTLDEFCRDQNIECCQFLKIDTEGNDLDVLRGANALLARDAINAIQFEFNEMNVISRAFLRDFYEILPGFEFFRLDTRRLIPLSKYSPTNEIFQFQNIVALRREA